MEEVFQWSLLQSHKATDEQFEKITSTLSTQLEAVEHELLQTQKDAMEYQQQQREGNESKISPNAVSSNDEENEAPSSRTAADSKSAKTAAAKSGKSRGVSVQIEITAGPHAGETFELRPTKKTACMVGRSRNKGFRTKGISLHKDLEVSTTHGCFELVNGAICFTDQSSTNGTWVNGEELQPYDPFQICDGTEITCGQTAMKTTLS